MYKLTHSISNWEDSYFGGFVKILRDYPEIKAPYDIETEMPKDDELTWSTREKLTDLFQLKIKDFGLINEFLSSANIEMHKDFFGKEKKFLVPSKSDTTFVLKEIIGKDSELANLFDHYAKTLIATKFLYPVPPEEKKKDKKKSEDEGGMDKKSGEKEEDEGEGNEGEDKDGKAKSGAMAEATEAAAREKMLKMARANAKSLIEDITKRKDSWGMNIGRAITGDLKKSTVFKLITKAANVAKYSAEEIMYAGQLLKMLDISFDPTHDKINNLKAGKLDIAKIATVPAGNHHIYFREEENQTTRPFSVCILMDESGSMGGTVGSSKGGYQSRIVKILYKAFSQILPPQKMFIYGHSDEETSGKRHSNPEVRIYHDNYNHVFEETIENQGRNRWGENYDGPIIECVYERVRSVTSDNIIFISISDGQPSGSNYGGQPAINDMKRIIEKCKRDGFVTVGIGVQYSGVKTIYNYNTVVNNMADMAKQVSSLINTVVKTEFQT